jgi:hypothetical protein
MPALPLQLTASATIRTGRWLDFKDGIPHILHCQIENGSCAACLQERSHVCVFVLMGRESTFENCQTRELWASQTLRQGQNAVADDSFQPQCFVHACH